MERPVVELEGVVRTYHLGKTEVRALRGVDLVVREQDFLCVLGPSGSGKSTLLNLVGCIDRPNAGTLRVDGENVLEMSDDALSAFRARRIGFIFQSFNLIAVLTAEENISYPLLLGGVSGSEAAKRVDEVCSRVGLSAFKHHYPNELSGGQRQRVAIARALVTRPALVLADEPTANLDSQTGTEILELMREMNEQLKTTFVFSTHDALVRNYARRIVHLHDGRIDADARPEPTAEVPHA